MPPKTLLDVLRERGIPLPDRVWDYQLAFPASVDDVAEMKIRWQSVVDDGGELGKAGEWNEATVAI